MGHHRRGRSTRRSAAAAEAVTPHAATPHAATPHAVTSDAAASGVAGMPSTAEGVGARPLEDLVEAARTARRTGWTFGSEVLATADTRGVPTSTPPPRDGRPRRYATHQPTAPIMILDAS